VASVIEPPSRRSWGEREARASRPSGVRRSSTMPACNASEPRDVRTLRMATINRNHNSHDDQCRSERLLPKHHNRHQESRMRRLLPRPDMSRAVLEVAASRCNHRRRAAGRHSRPPVPADGEEAIVDSVVGSFCDARTQLRVVMSAPSPLIVSNGIPCASCNPR
jgi:hypothetical protein